ncbi:transposase [Parageobacillus thermoglucosidasius]|uniref:transposase n=1 Tax=Parageobacillus thermoglucosidasius TaxID=1426 RepID=UPI002E21B91E|nr:transposase [Parageobacillus thermoglucosidasius]MED4915997.1 transposase [Parageobacillus thermoglucosidasius]MED4984788.1 transposase [Parageobacillus thermoglucosidasius]
MDPDSVLLYLDETHIRSYHVLRSTWSEVGRQKQVPTFGHHAHVSLFGAVNIHDGETVLHQTTSANAATFLDFLRMLKERYPDRLAIRTVSWSWCWITPAFTMPKWSRSFCGKKGSVFTLFTFLPIRHS